MKVNFFASIFAIPSSKRHDEKRCEMLEILFVVFLASINISCPAEHHQSGETNNNHETINEASGSGTGTNPGSSGGTSTNFGTISSTSTNLIHQSTEESNGGSYAMIDLDKTHAIAALNAGQSNPTDEGIIYFFLMVHPTRGSPS